MSIDTEIRHFQIQPSDQKAQDPKRALPVAPANGRVSLTRRSQGSAENGIVVGTRPRAITPDGPNQFNGNQQVGMETRGGASSVMISTPDDADYGLINAWTYSGWDVVMNGPFAVNFSLAGADDAPGVVTRDAANGYVYREFWVHVTFILNGFDITWPADMYWPGAEAVEVDTTLPRFEATFLVKQRGVGGDPEVTFWGGDSYGQVAQPASGA